MNILSGVGNIVGVAGAAGKAIGAAVSALGKKSTPTPNKPTSLPVPPDAASSAAVSTAAKPALTAAANAAALAGNAAAAAAAGAPTPLPGARAVTPVPADPKEILKKMTDGIKQKILENAHLQGAFKKNRLAKLETIRASVTPTMTPTAQKELLGRLAQFIQTEKIDAVAVAPLYNLWKNGISPTDQPLNEWLQERKAEATEFKKQSQGLKECAELLAAEEKTTPAGATPPFQSFLEEHEYSEFSASDFGTAAAKYNQMKNQGPPNKQQLEQKKAELEKLQTDNKKRETSLKQTGSNINQQLVELTHFGKDTAQNDAKKSLTAVNAEFNTSELNIEVNSNEIAKKKSEIAKKSAEITNTQDNISTISKNFPTSSQLTTLNTSLRELKETHNRLKDELKKLEDKTEYLTLNRATLYARKTHFDTILENIKNGNWSPAQQVLAEIQHKIKKVNKEIASLAAPGMASVNSPKNMQSLEKQKEEFQIELSIAEQYHKQETEIKKSEKELTDQSAMIEKYKLDHHIDVQADGTFKVNNKTVTDSQEVKFLKIMLENQKKMKVNLDSLIIEHGKGIDAVVEKEVAKLNQTVATKQAEIAAEAQKANDAAARTEADYEILAGKFKIPGPPPLPTAATGGTLAAHQAGPAGAPSSPPPRSNESSDGKGADPNPNEQPD